MISAKIILIEFVMDDIVLIAKTIYKLLITIELV